MFFCREGVEKNLEVARLCILLDAMEGKKRKVIQGQTNWIKPLNLPLYACFGLG